MKHDRYPVHGAGLGLRRTLMGPLADQPSLPVDFFEVAPENWIGVGGRYGKQFRAFTERYPFVTHGLSLSLGGPAPLDEVFLHQLKRFLDAHHIASLHRASQLLQRRWSSLRSDADPVHRRGGYACVCAYPPRAGHSATAHCRRKRVLLRRARPGDERDRFPQRRARRGRLRSAARCEQHLRQQREPPL